VSRILVITAVVEEFAAVAEPFFCQAGPASPYPTETAATSAGDVVIMAAGVGMAAAAAATAYAFGQEPFDVVLSMGIGGGFDGRAAVGDVVVATSSVACQLGADSPDGYLDFGSLGLAETVLTTTGNVAVLAARLGAVSGAVLSVSTVTGTDARAAEYAERWDPVAEAMEGFGVWTAAKAARVVPYEIRAISNRVGRRDRTSWDIAGALAALTRASKRLFEEPLP
jgi:futalosine hydrolase